MRHMGMKHRAAFCFAVFFLCVTEPGFLLEVSAEAHQSFSEKQADLEEYEESHAQEQEKEILEILDEGTEGESAEEFLDNIEAAAHKALEQYEEEEEGTFLDSLLRWLTDMVNQVFDILLDFLKDV